MQPTVQKFAKVIFLTILIPTLVIIALSLLRQYRRWRLGVLRADDEEALRRLGEYRVVKQTWHGWKATTPEGVDLKIPKRQSRTQVRTFSRPGRKISGWQKAVYPQSTSRANGDENENEEELRRQMRRSSTARRASGAMPRLPSVAYSRPGRPDRLGRSRHPSGRAAPLASTRTTEVTGSSGSEVMHPSTRKCNKDAYDHSQWEFNRVVDLKLNRIWKYFHPEIHDFPNKDAMMPPAWQPGDPEGSDDDDVSTAYTTVISGVGPCKKSEKSTASDPNNDKHEYEPGLEPEREQGSESSEYYECNAYPAPPGPRTECLCDPGLKCKCKEKIDFEYFDMKLEQRLGSEKLGRDAADIGHVA